MQSGVERRTVAGIKGRIEKNDAADNSRRTEDFHRDSAWNIAQNRWSHDAAAFAERRFLAAIDTSIASTY